jgi:hypothetical protein
MKTKIVLPLLLLSAVAVTPAYANWFHNPYTNVYLNVGSAPNPTPRDIRENRLPVVVEDVAGTDVATSDPAKNTAKTATAPAKADSRAISQSGGATSVPAASPSR